MKLLIQSRFDCPTEKIIEAVVTSKLMLAVCNPLVRFMPISPAVFPEIWKPGEYLVKIYLFRKIPLGTHTIRIFYPKSDLQDLFQLRDNGTGQMVPTWDHLITIQNLGSRGTLYRDQVNIKAGKITFFVWLFAQYYYRHRQRRWKQLIKSNFDYNAI